MWNIAFLKSVLFWQNWEVEHLTTSSL
jgi:hypothetical protein